MDHLKKSHTLGIAKLLITLETLFSFVVVIPRIISAHVKYALLGLTHLLRLIGNLMDEHAPGMQIMALSRMFVERQMADKEVRNLVIQRFKPSNVFKTTITRAIAISQAAMANQSVWEIDPLSPGAAAFLDSFPQTHDHLSHAAFVVRPNRITSPSVHVCTWQLPFQVLQDTKSL